MLDGCFVPDYFDFVAFYFDVPYDVCVDEGGGHFFDPTWDFADWNGFVFARQYAIAIFFALLI